MLGGKYACKWMLISFQGQSSDVETPFQEDKKGKWTGAGHMTGQAEVSKDRVSSEGGRRRHMAERDSVESGWSCPNPTAPERAAQNKAFSK